MDKSIKPKKSRTAFHNIKKALPLCPILAATLKHTYDLEHCSSSIGVFRHGSIGSLSKILVSEVILDLYDNANEGTFVRSKEPLKVASSLLPSNKFRIYCFALFHV